jgi:hypothetical protein
MQPRQHAARETRQIRQGHLYQNLTRAPDPDRDLSLAAKMLHAAGRTNGYRYLRATEYAMALTRLSDIPTLRTGKP